MVFWRIILSIILFLCSIITPISVPFKNSPNIISSALAFETNPAGYEAPIQISEKEVKFQGESYHFLKQMDRDVHKDGEPETIARLYRSSQGKILASWKSDEILWAWSIFLNPYHRETDKINNYTILKSNCSIFDEKYGPYEEMDMPLCIKR